MSEKQLHQSVCDFIKYKYPHVLLNVDLSGQNMSPMIGAQLKRLRSNSGYPDIVIYKKKGNFGACFIELKVEGYKLYNKQGELKTDHLKNQEECMRRLREEGYYATFAIGIDHAIAVVETYMNLI